MKAKKTFDSPASIEASTPPPTNEQIAALAHAIWLDRGCPEGRDLDNWLEAERQLRVASLRRPTAASSTLPADDAVDPARAEAGRIEREMDRVVGQPGPRSPTAL